MSLRIVYFYGENFKKLRTVEFEPDPNDVTLSGGNEEGKSSTLDLVQAVLQPKEVMDRTPKPIREGEEKALGLVSLGEPSYDEYGNEIACKPVLKASRTFTAKGSYLKLENAEGMQFKSPQAILDELIGSLMFDPLAFSNLKDKDQLEKLLKLVKIDLDLEQWAKDRKAVYDERTLINRDVATLEGQTKGVVSFPHDTPDEEVSAAAVLDEQQEAQKVIDTHKETRTNARLAHEQLARLLASRRELKSEIARLEDALTDAKKQLETNQDVSASVSSRCGKLDAECETLVDPDLSVFQDRITQVEQINLNVRAKKQAAILRDQLQAKRAESIAASEKLVTMDHQRAEALAAAKMPIEDLSFDDNGVTYKGIPFRQCSSEERLRVSVAMGMALNPKLRVMFVRDASLLDTKHRKVIKQMAKDERYQLWYEVADDSGNVGLYFQDGEIVNQPVKTKAARKAKAV